MATPTQNELLAAAAVVDAGINAHTIKIGKAILSVGSQEAAPVLPVHKLSLDNEDDDPFNGNVNNRKVAERIAAQNRTLYTNAHKIIHTGDPGKAARDVAKSKESNPDSLTSSELDEVANSELAANLKKVPSPGSPAATQAAGATKEQPKVWTPGAGPQR